MRGGAKLPAGFVSILHVVFVSIATKGSRNRRGALDIWHPYTGNAPFDSRYVFIFEHMSEARAKTGPRTNERLGATTLTTTL